MIKLGKSLSNQRLRVLYVEEGLSNPAKNLLPLLKSHVTYYLVSAERDVNFAHQHSFEISTFPEPKFPVQRAWIMRKLVTKILKNTRIDLVHSHSGTDFLLPTTVPVITHVHGSWFSDWIRSWGTSNILNKMRHLVGYLHYVVPESISIKKATHIIAVSEQVKRELIQLYGLRPERITVIYNAVPEYVYNLGRNKCKDDPPLLIYVGRLHPSKGIREFTSAFVREKQLNVDFIIIGDGPERPFLLSLASKDPRIHLLGGLQHLEVLQWLERTNIFIFPTFYEGHSIALLEAMASGHACIVRNIPVMEEVLGWEAGILCNDVHTMVEALADLVSNPGKRFELQMLAKQRASEFSWHKSARILLELYQKVARGDL
jgi:glycosyltransferase involved in cell wall biosynthesis